MPLETSTPAPTASPLDRALEKRRLLAGKRDFWWWVAIVAGAVALLAVCVSFYVTMHYFSLAGRAMGAADFQSADAENARDAMHSHTVSAMASLSVGLTIFAVGTVVFLGSLAQFLGLRSRTSEARLAAERALAEAAQRENAAEEGVEEAHAELERPQQSVAPASSVPAPARIPSDEESARFAAILERPDSTDKPV